MSQHHRETPDRDPPDLSHIPPLAVRARQAVVPVLVLAMIFVAIFMGLSMEMSSPYTRESPDCSFWCSTEHKVRDFFGAGSGG